MAKNPTLEFKTAVVPLNWANISGQGKLKFDPTNSLDKDDQSNYIYTITTTLTKEQAEDYTAQFTKFWRENKPAGVTKQKYDIIKKEMAPTLDDDGKEQKDEDGEVIKHHTGSYTLEAKTTTVWPSGDANIVKVLRANGKPLNLNGKVIGFGSLGVIHGQIGISAFKGNEGLAFYLNGVQLKKFVEHTGGGEVHADDLGDDEGMDDLDMEEALPDETSNGPTV